MQKTVLLYFALLFWFVVPVKAQLTFSLPEITADNGTQIGMDLEVSNFTNIGSAQFTFSWDSSIIEFVDIKDIAFPNFIPNQNLNLTKVENGYLVIAWFTPGSFDLNDGDALFSVVFNVIGNPGDTSLVGFTDVPTPILFGDPANNAFEVEGPNGKVIIPGPSATINPEDFGWEVKPSSPNPFSELSQIAFYTPNATHVEWTIFDAIGNTILIDNKEYAPGQHKYFLEQQFLPANGIYFVQMRTLEFITTQKVNFNK